MNEKVGKERPSQLHKKVMLSQGKNVLFGFPSI